MAALLAGQSMSQVAEAYSLPLGTIKSWSARLRKLQPVEPENGRPSIEELLGTFLEETLITLSVQARHFRDPDWLAKQSASELAVLHGVETDKAVRLLEAAERAVTAFGVETGDPA